MSSDNDDDAFNWDGDDDPTLSLATTKQAKAGMTSAAAVPLTDAVVLEDSAASAEASEGVSNFSLLLYGVFAGVYLLYSAGWALVASSLVTAAVALGVTPFFEGVSFVMAVLVVLAPALWFGAVWFNARRNGVRLLLLAAGALVLLPWPLLMGVVR